MKTERPFLERAAGIEPVPSAWEAEILPLNYARGEYSYIIHPNGLFVKGFRTFFFGLKDFVIISPGSGNTIVTRSKNGE